MRLLINFLWLFMVLSLAGVTAQAQNSESTRRISPKNQYSTSSKALPGKQQRSRTRKNAKRRVQKAQRIKKSPFILSFQEMRKLPYKKRVVYLRRLAKQLVIMEELLSKKKSRKTASFLNSGLDFVSWFLSEAKADPQYLCIGGGVPIESSAASCGANSYGGFSCPDGQEICNPFIFGVQDVTDQARQPHDESREEGDGERFYRAVCFDNATTRRCYDGVRVGRETSGSVIGTVLAPVVNNLERYQEYEQMISTLTQMCGYQGRGMTAERASDPGAFNRACQRVKDQTAVNRRRDLLDTARLVERSEQERRDREFYEISVGEGHCLYANTYNMQQNRYERTDQCIEDGSVVIQNGPALPNGWVPVSINGEQRYILSETSNGTVYAQTTDRLPTLSIVEDQNRQIDSDFRAFSASELAAMSPQNRYFAEEFNRMLSAGYPERLDCRRGSNGRRTSGRWLQTSHCMLCNCVGEASRSGISVNPEHDRNDSHRYSILMVTLRRVLSPAFPLHGTCGSSGHTGGSGSDGACIARDNPNSRVCSVIVDRSQFSWANYNRNGHGPQLHTPTLGYSNSTRTNETHQSYIRNCYKNSLYSLRETAMGRNYYPTNYARDYLHGRRGWTTTANRVQVPGEPLKIGGHYFYQPSLGSTYHSGYAMQETER